MIDINPEQIDEFNPELIIDARSPKEYAYSHLPDAQNYYALSDLEHKEVGTIYKNTSKHHAKVLGASYVCKNASTHLLELEKKINTASKIAIYCARGGLRSKSLGIILEQVGYRVARISGGYKSYRNYVLNVLESELETNFITLFGNTGCGKTELLSHLNPSIDLEGLANHQGSSFGQIHGRQPSAKTFQDNLAYKLTHLPKDKACFIEGESKKIGALSLPNNLYDKMQNGISVVITSSMEFRVKRILKDYENISDEYFYLCMERIKPYIKKTIHHEVIESYEKNELENVAYLLLENYYDKVYKKPKKVDFTINYDDNLQETLRKLESIKSSI